MTIHTSTGIGAQQALVAQVNYNDSVGAMLNVMVNSILPSLTTAVSTLSTQMNNALTAISTAQQTYVDEWAGDPNAGGNPTNWNTWIATYGAGGSKYDDPIAQEIIDGANILTHYGFDFYDALSMQWNGTENGGSPHANLSKTLSSYQTRYNTSQLDYQSKLSAAQQPIDLWAHTINAVNKTQVTNYKLMEPLTSIWKNLINKTSNK